MLSQHMTIRLARTDDEPSLHRLAALDSAPELTGSVLLATVDEAPVAAVSLETAAVTADPFRHTADAVRLLRLRCDQLLDRAGAALDRAELRVAHAT